MLFKKNNLITILPEVGSEFKIEFDLYLSEYGKYPWYNILLGAVDKGRNEYIKYGDRLPGIFVHHDKTLWICSAVNGNSNYCHITGTKLKKWTAVEICQHVLDGEGGGSFQI